MSGIVLAKTPVFFEYHLKICDRFLDRVCYSDKSVFVIFFERLAGNLFVVFLLFLGGVHPCALFLPFTALAYRAHLFGGTIYILFSVYKVSGAVVAFVLYLPIHLLSDAVMLIAASLSCTRAFRFRFCGQDLKEMGLDFLVFAAGLFLVCLLEMIILGALFHPMGNLL